MLAEHQKKIGVGSGVKLLIKTGNNYNSTNVIVICY